MQIRFKGGLGKTLTVGIIGLGRRGMLHLMDCLQMDSIKVVAAADRSKKLMKKAKSVGVNRLYKDYHELLARAYDWC